MNKKEVRKIIVSGMLLLLSITGTIGCLKKADKELSLEPLDQKRAEIEQYQNLVSVGSFHILGVKPDGTVYSWGENRYGECNTKDWTDIVAVSASEYISVGIKSDGTVVATGLNDLGQCETGDWTNIVEVAVSKTHVLGLKSDGTVVATGKIVPKEGMGEETLQTRNEMVKDWTNIKHIAAYNNVAIGIKQDGTTIWSDYVSGGFTNELVVGSYEGWNNIIEIKREMFYWMGLSADGTVKIPDKLGNRTAEEWTNIVDIATGIDHYVGLKSNGMLVYAGTNEYKQCEVDEWRDILAIYGGAYITVGLQEDGTLIFSGNSTKAITENPEEGQTDPKEWDLI